MKISKLSILSVFGGFPAMVSAKKDTVRGGSYLLDYSRRSLQTIGDCDSYGFDIIEMNLVLDSTFCDALGLGDEDTAKSAAQAIVDTANSFYGVDDLCKKIVVNSFDVFCDSMTDPIVGVFEESGGIVCQSQSSENVLSRFASWWFNEYLDSNFDPAGMY